MLPALICWSNRFLTNPSHSYNLLYLRLRILSTCQLKDHFMRESTIDVNMLRHGMFRNPSLRAVNDRKRRPLRTNRVKDIDTKLDTPPENVRPITIQACRD